jgi:hypothetical protein
MNIELREETSGQDPGILPTPAVERQQRTEGNFMHEGGRVMESMLLQINFKFNVSREDYEKAVSPLADDFAAVEGLTWKIWLMNESQSEAGGIMLFDDESSLKAFLESPLASKVTGHPALSEMSVKSFGIMGKVSSITRGPLEPVGKTSG